MFKDVCAAHEKAENVHKENSSLFLDLIFVLSSRAKSIKTSTFNVHDVSKKLPETIRARRSLMLC